MGEAVGKSLIEKYFCTVETNRIVAIRAHFNKASNWQIVAHLKTVYPVRLEIGADKE